MVRVLIVDDHMIIRRGLSQILAENPRIAHIGEAADGPSAMRELRSGPYDVVLLDIALGERDGLDVLKSIRNEFPTLGVIMLSVYPETQFGVRSIRSGANAYLNKGSSPEELYAAVFKVAEGGIYVTPVVAELLARNVRQDRVGAPHEVLSNREFQVLQLLVNGHTISEIAHQLSLSVNTISTYRGRICDKLNARSVAELIAYSSEHRLFSV
jgi:DNA-binding NarL/FixJ family response regulator